ncbi:hypothetical protein SDC9_211627 [bioreactor metagenome]|uniref:Uncharacterized protein n=1 Tax=bioreactor metagenome TaxID=1076179 RepID=A0A645JL77_9ZZZZ
MVNSYKAGSAAFLLAVKAVPLLTWPEATWSILTLTLTAAPALAPEVSSFNFSGSEETAESWLKAEDFVLPIRLDREFFMAKEPDLMVDK